jgi:hypothetical protein
MLRVADGECVAEMGPHFGSARWRCSRSQRAAPPARLVSAGCPVVIVDSGQFRSPWNPHAGLDARDTKAAGSTGAIALAGARLR